MVLRKRDGCPLRMGKKTYEEMSKEEQGIVDAFEGKASYEKIMTHSSHYSIKAQALLPQIA